MSISIENQNYLTTEEAGILSGYTIDYVGQLCRAKKIECRRVSGHWFVNETSFRSYLTSNGITPKEDTKERGATEHMESDDIFVREGVEYISTARAADLTGYTQDYVGQLARGGEITARKVGRRWFAGRESLLQYKKANELPIQQSDAVNQTHTTESADTHNRASEPATHGTEVKISTSAENITLARKEPAAPDISFNVKYTTETDTPLIPKLQLQKSPAKTVTVNYERGDITKEQTVAGVEVAPQGAVKSSQLIQPTPVRVPKKPNSYVSRQDSVRRVQSLEYKSYSGGNRKSKSGWLLGPMLLVALSIMLLLGVRYVAAPSQNEVEGAQNSVIQKLKTSIMEAYTIVPGTNYTYTKGK